MKLINKVFDKAVPICFAANSGFIPYTAVMIESIIENASADENYDIVVLYTDVDDERIAKTLSLAEKHPNVSIRFVDISEYVSSFSLYTDSVYTGTVYSAEAYYRLLIPSLMPAYDKVLYFDGDMVALSDVKELYYSTDMTGYMLASSRDFGGISNCYMENDDRRRYREVDLGLKNVDNYIISGMLVFNIAEFNKRYTGQQLMQICASRDWRQHDQDVLNVICEDSLLIVDAGWDFLEDYGLVKHLPPHLLEEYERSAENIKVLHYAGPRKPWRNNKAYGLEHFWKYCYNTPFFSEIYNSVYKNYGYKSLIFDILEKDLTLDFKKGDAEASCEGYFVANLADIYTKIDFINYQNGRLSVEGFMNFIGLSEDESAEIYVSINRKLHKCRITDRKCNEYRGERLFYRGIAFSFSEKISVKRALKLKIVAKIKGKHYIVSRCLRFGVFCGLNETPKKYFFAEGAIFTLKGNIIHLFDSGRKAILSHEIAYQKALKNKKTALKRIVYYLHKIFSKKKIWLIADRYNKAGDSGEVLFEYLKKNKIKGVKPYFVISKYSKDYKRMKRRGGVIPLESRKFRFMRVYADKLISSHCDNEFAYDYDKKGLSDLIAKQHTIFLQHGITKDDLSAIYSKPKNNFALFLTSAERELKSIIENPNYAFAEDEVKLTGLARYDGLKNEREKIVAIVPTWRRYCLMRCSIGWKRKRDYLTTEYYEFYSRLLTDERLVKTAKEYGYKILFVPHPLMADDVDVFNFGEGVIGVRDCDYTELFSKTALMLTDFSSTAFDMAYLRKPVLYTHFDKEIFFKNQYSEGYFDYERDGFGEVAYDYESTVSMLVDYIKNDCALKPEYERRIDGFFAFSDTKNCERIVAEILKLK